jgi:4-hydroxybenzoate polyprenyltransferase
MNLAATILFLIWCGFVVLGMLGYVFKTLEDYRIDEINLDEVDNDNVR